ncbi:MAG: hypothetical protein JWO70_5323 [Betaproteobacteria bacterium]|nr:hypothetical protein [Betaproteobacteria bacterium]
MQCVNEIGRQARAFRMGLRRCRWGRRRAARNDGNTRRTYDRPRAPREFMVEFAEAYCAAALTEFGATFSLPHGAVTIRVTTNEIKGAGDESRESLGLGLIAAAISREIGAGPHLRRYVATLSGQVTGRAGTFQLTVDILNAATSAIPDSTRKTEGLLIIQPDLQVIKLLERDKNKTQVVVAPRKIDTTAVGTL